MSAAVQNYLTGALDVDVDALLVQNHRAHSFSAAAEGHFLKNRVGFPQFLDLDSGSVDEFEHRNFGGGTAFFGMNIGRGIDDQGLYEVDLVGFGHVVIQVDVLGVGVNHDRTRVPHLLNVHLILRERARLVGANHVGAAHRLTGRHLSHQIIVEQHFLNGEGQRKRDGKRQSLGNSDDHNCDGDNKVSYDVTSVRVIPPINFVRLVDDHSDYQHQKDHDRTHQTEFTDVLLLLTKNIKLLSNIS